MEKLEAYIWSLSHDLSQEVRAVSWCILGIRWERWCFEFLALDKRHVVGGTVGRQHSYCGSWPVLLAEETARNYCGPRGCFPAVLAFGGLYDWLWQAGSAFWLM